MSRYLEVKPGSISEIAKKLKEDYDAYFKKELEKTGKSLASMTDAEKKAFFNRVDKGWNAKNEATSNQVSYDLGNKENKTTLVAAPGGKEKVIRIPKEKLADYKKKGYVEAEEFVPEAAKNPYAIGMAAAMKATGDKPPLKKSTIVKAHDIAKKIEKNEDAQADKENESQKKKEGEKDFVKKAAKGKSDIINEGGMKEIDTNKKELERLSVRLSNLRDKKNAAAGADTSSVEKEIKQVQMSMIDLKKKLASKKEEVETVEEAAGPDRLTNLNDKISRLQVNLQKLDKSKPESKTKEAIIRSDLATAKLRLQDLMQKKNTENTQTKVKVESKLNYKSMKKTLKNEKTLTGQSKTKIDTEPKLN